MSFNEQLTKLRKRKNINQIKLAEMMNVKQYVISSWETGRSEPNINQIIKLSDILDVPIDYLLDKPLVVVSNESDYNKMIENVKMDSNDDFLIEIKKICEGMSKSKKDKLIKIIKNINEY